MQYIIALIILSTSACQYFSPELERAVEKEIIQDVEKVADANINDGPTGATGPAQTVAKQ